jgi:hypothetical protein
MPILFPALDPWFRRKFAGQCEDREIRCLDAATLWGQAFSLPPGFRPALPGIDEG